jgi:hypothetical protein
MSPGIVERSQLKSRLLLCRGGDGKMRIEFVSPIEEIEEENDNVDVFLHLDDGRAHSFVVATPNNIYRCMHNGGLDYFFGVPPVFVERMTPENVERALRAIVTEYGGKWLSVYGALQARAADDE